MGTVPRMWNRPAVLLAIRNVWVGTAGRTRPELPEHASCVDHTFGSYAGLGGAGVSPLRCWADVRPQPPDCRGFRTEGLIVNLPSMTQWPPCRPLRGHEIRHDTTMRTQPRAQQVSLRRSLDKALFRRAEA